MRAAERQVQEAERIEERLPLRAVQLEHRLAADLCRARAVGMAAHAVHHDEQCRTVACSDSGAILVVFAIAGQAGFGELDRHASPGSPMAAAPC
jgi:hypothetical protein